MSSPIDTEPTKKHHLIVDLFSVLGVKCSMAIQIERLMLSQQIVKNLVESGHLDVEEAIQKHMKNYVGMSREDMMRKQNNKMMIELVQLLCLRLERGIKFKGSGWHFDERMDNAVFLVPHKDC